MINTLRIDGALFTVSSCDIKAVLYPEGIAWNISIDCDPGELDGVSISPSLYSESLPGLTGIKQLSDLNNRVLTWNKAYDDDTDEPYFTIVLASHSAIDRGEVRFSTSSEDKDPLVVVVQGAADLMDRDSPEGGSADIYCEATVDFGGVYVRADNEASARAIVSDQALLDGLRFEHNTPPAWSGFVPTD